MPGLTTAVPPRTRGVGYSPCCAQSYHRRWTESFAVSQSIATPVGPVLAANGGRATLSRPRPRRSPRTRRRRRRTHPSTAGTGRCPRRRRPSRRAAAAAAARGEVGLQGERSADGEDRPEHAPEEVAQHGAVGGDVAGAGLVVAARVGSGIEAGPRGEHPTEERTQQPDADPPGGVRRADRERLFAGTRASSRIFVPILSTGGTVSESDRRGRGAAHAPADPLGRPRLSRPRSGSGSARPSAGPRLSRPRRPRCRTSRGRCGRRRTVRPRPRSGARRPPQAGSGSGRST